MATINEAKIYVGTYAKYNEGSIAGAWLSVSDYESKEEFYDACRELHNDEEDPEFMFQDYENIPEGLIGESWVSENLFTIAAAVENSYLDEDIIFAYIALRSYGIAQNDIEDIINDAEDAYAGQYDSDEDFAEDIMTQCGYEVPAWIGRHIDWKGIARDLMYDYEEEDGYYFRVA